MILAFHLHFPVNSCTMPSIEVGTVGGGTNLPAQSACLEVWNAVENLIIIMTGINFTFWCRQRKFVLFL